MTPRESFALCFGSEIEPDHTQGPEWAGWQVRLPDGPHPQVKSVIVYYPEGDPRYWQVCIRDRTQSVCVSREYPETKPVETVERLTRFWLNTMGGEAA